MSSSSASSSSLVAFFLPLAFLFVAAFFGAVFVAGLLAVVFFAVVVFAALFFVAVAFLCPGLVAVFAFFAAGFLPVPPSPPRFFFGGSGSGTYQSGFLVTRPDLVCGADIVAFVP